MDAIDYLTEQHHQIECLFDEFESATRMDAKLRLWRKLADLLAIHRAIEEHIFYPAASDSEMKVPFLTALDGHVSAERIVAELVEVDEVNDEFVAKMAVLKKWKTQHSDHEERKLFPHARERLTRSHLELLGRRMAEVAHRLMHFTVTHLRTTPIASA